MKKHLRNSTGLSMLEAIVGIALLGLTVIAVMQLSSSTSTTARELAMASTEYKNIISRVNSLFSNPTFCRLALGGHATNPNAAPPSSTRQPVAGMATGTARSIILYEPKASPRTKFMDPDDNSYNRFGLWKSVSLTIEPAFGVTIPGGVTDNIPAVVTIVMERASGTATAQRMEKKLNLSVRLDSGFIRSCSLITYASDDNPVPVCAGADEGLRSLGTRVVCRKIKCPPSKVSCGIDANGDVICQNTCP